MGLVDYSSGSDSDSASSTPAKRRRTSASSSSAVTARTKPPPPPPPLPAAFHDLYASTVRVSTVDDPSLHQGRKRVNPHKVGNWPSHLYIDVRPTDSDRALLDGLVARITRRLATAAAASDSNTASTGAVPVYSFLSSDLGAPQPLHISLSRPLALQTAQKDAFLDGAREAVARSGIAGPFRLHVLGVYWHRTRESERSFLVLKVASATTRPRPAQSPEDKVLPKGDDDDDDAAGQDQTPAAWGPTTTNPELQALLGQFNALAAEFGQPALYATNPAGRGGGGEGRGGPPSTTPASKAAVRDAFHVSIAWSPAIPTPRIRAVTAEEAAAGLLPPLDDSNKAATAAAAAEGDPQNNHHHHTSSLPPPLSSAAGSQGSHAARLRRMTFDIDAIKLKVGNVITSIPL
ncbi:U6 snRNA phosphodiesterase Usb1 [Microdochium trichocladiopsis]|uniref:U6 snRNA phosphodiesterase n=1 Tax=Microdochium trichocladiopsis TaxID=1682393 RepID=A0A9P8Y1F8_9PEZI|nr:U6 snRNA phosphodiesterase Usb1 [Microdochium trichocladiopsis]KAH7027435.1 U6 snRNA phosphodiesterase Usb1 [Microdochium trichocladiopsis]